MRKICIATGTRADWGLLSPIAKALQQREDVKLQIVATNMHLSPKFGNTYKEILADGFKINCHVPMMDNPDSPADTVRSMSMAMHGFADAFEELKPDLLIILGDRYEMLAVVSAALIFRIPVAHIAGGAITEGAFDDSIRHSITKMSHIHLTETDEYRNRVIQLGEDPEYVFNVGSIGIHNILNMPLLSAEEVSKQIGMNVDRNTLIVTFHPATLDSENPIEQCQNMLRAINTHSECNTIFTYPNNDSHGREIINLIEEYVGRNRGNAVVFPSLGALRYLSVLKYAGAAVGNSSSGIIEVPSMGIPTLDIGVRQRGRMAAASVRHCGVSLEDIKAGLDEILTPEFREMAKNCQNPYQQPDILERIVKIVCETPLDNITVKHFHDIHI